MAWLRNGLERRAERALERQLDYQRRKARGLAGHEQERVSVMMERSSRVRAKLEEVKPVRQHHRVVEVGSGAHGLIFFFGTDEAVGVDPLADHYAELFPQWQHRARTVAAGGERLPFPDSSFDIVLCDNVVDHAENPPQIVRELARVLRPGGLLYFTVNVHHPFYHVASTLHAGWRALGIPFEITPFADHTVHLTQRGARKLFEGLPLRPARESDNVAETKQRSRHLAPRHLGDRLKRLFYKNATYELIAERLA